MLKNIAQLSSEVMDYATLLQLVLSSYSIIRDKSRRDIRPLQKFRKANLVTYVLNVIEDIESNKESSIEAVCFGDSVIG